MTVSLWRIGTDTPDYTADDLSGTGAKRSGGRWNPRGIALVYASGTIALACLETLVHLNARSLPLNRYLVRIDVPDEVFDRRVRFEEFVSARRQVGWDALPAGSVSVDAGRRWVTGGDSAIFDVPSVVIEEERNCLINPLHPDADLITATKIRKFRWDERLK